MTTRICDHGPSVASIFPSDTARFWASEKRCILHASCIDDGSITGNK